MPVYLRLVEVVSLAVLGAEFGTVTGYEFSTDQIKMFCDLNSCPEDLANGFFIIPAEIGDCVMVSCLFFCP